MDNKRANRKEEVGIVISDKAQKTIIVRVQRLVRHDKYSKTIKKFNKFKAHDEKNEAKVGDKVSIAETRPISKDKRWRLVKILNKAVL
ncbi:MAG: 30S ribosomal protein S17 [Candidatus Omnitrophica bacterium]|nr:30S ribosomal protein S17 [Candidatus Omnitrophota bacterium]MDD5355161.1 30S ribosomal protein S17 [Candidatus Omnitrophota bacterium]